MNRVETSAKTVDDAKAEALRALEATEEQVDFTVLDPGDRGLFGILGAKPARVRAILKPDPERATKSFLQAVTKAMGMTVACEVRRTEHKIYVNLKGDGLGALIGKHGQTLDSLQYIVNLAVNKGEVPYMGVTLDTENYRQRRRETLESLARNLAKRAKLTQNKVVLEPMNPYERRVIHAALHMDKTIDTFSEGDEPQRYVVIVPK